MVWIETPTNPLLKLVDIQGAAEIVHQHEVSLLDHTKCMYNLDYSLQYAF